jgi:hypothetical protein
MRYVVVVAMVCLLVFSGVVSLRRLRGTDRAERSTGGLLLLLGSFAWAVYLGAWLAYQLVTG